MPLTKKGKKIMKAMKEQYGKESGKRVFYAAENKGSIKGVAKAKGGLVEKATGEKYPSKAAMQKHEKGETKMEQKREMKGCPKCGKPMKMAKGGAVGKPSCMACGGMVKGKK